MSAKAPERNGTFPHDVRAAVPVYLACHLAPIDMPPRSKDPGYPGWQHKRISAEDIDACFPPGQPRNIAVLNGGPSGNTVDVDLDVAEARRIAKQMLPTTGWIFGRPSSPRSHYVYRTQSELASAKVAFEDVDGTMLVELRGSGGLTVFPPSLHKETGEPIAWDTFTEPAELPLDELRRAVSELAAATLIARHWPNEGSRDNAAMAITGALLRAPGWDEERVSRFTYAIAVASGDEEARMRAGKTKGTANKQAEGRSTTGWPRLAEVLGQDGEAVVRRVREWLGLVSPTKQQTPGKAPTIKRVRKVAPFKPFPLHTLPPILTELVTTAAASIGCDEALVAIPSLAVAASAIGNARAILLKHGWIEPAIVWALTVNDSGQHKSPAYSAAVDPLVSFQMDLFELHREQCEGYQQTLEDWQALPKDQRGEKPAPPAEPEIFHTSDTTIEQLGVLLEKRPKGLLVARDELDAWFGSFTRYKGKGGGSDRAQWLELHRAGTLRVDRLTREQKRVSVRRASVSLTGTIQPAVLAKSLDEDAMLSGLGARFLMAMPPRRKRVWTEAEMPDEVVNRYQALLTALLNLPLADVKKRKPHILGLSGDARRLWIDFYNEWGEVQYNAEGEQSACFAKIEGYASRLMLIHHVVSHIGADVDDCRSITETSARAGIELARWFAAEAVRIYTTFSESNEERGARRLVEHIQARGGKITVKELQRSNQRKYPSSTDAEAALGALAEVGLGRWEDRPAGPQGGRPTRVFILCVTYDETDETPDEDDDDGGLSYDETGDETPGGPGGHAVFQAEDEVSSVSSYVTHDNHGAENPLRGRVVGNGVSSPRSEVSSHSDKFMFVNDSAGLAMVQSALDSTAVVGLDTETTGLSARHDRMRLLSIATDTIDGGTYTYLVDCFRVDPSPLWDVLAEKNLVLHNAVFDLGFLARLGFTPAAKVNDTMLLSRVLHAGARERHGLADCVQRELTQDLPKEHQRADWSGTLTGEMLAYAAKDAAVLQPLHAAITAKIHEAHLEQTADIEARCLPAVTWMAGKGVAVDREAWSALAGQAKDDADRLRQQMTELATVRPGEMFVTRNIDSHADVLHLFTTLGCKIDSTDDETLAGIDHPIAGYMRQYREATKKTGTYGIAWLKHIAVDGRVYPSWNQIGAEATGRMSCSDPNMQQIPRDKAYRQCIVAPVGRVLVKADYSQIELRIAAKVSGDKAMLKAYQDGLDLHTLTARAVLGVEDVTKEHRQLAKSLNFGLLYGMGAPAFRQYAATEFGVNLTEEQAQQYRAAFFKSYPGLRAWHTRTGKTKDEAIVTRTLAGRRRLDVGRFTEKLNTPVQGTGGDGLKLALALLWERREQIPTAFPVLAVHDEIVLEADATQADAAAAWLKQAMLGAMAPLIAPVPVGVDVRVSRTWGGD